MTDRKKIQEAIRFFRERDMDLRQKQDGLSQGGAFAYAQCADHLQWMIDCPSLNMEEGVTDVPFEE